MSGKSPELATVPSPSAVYGNWGLDPIVNVAGTMTYLGSSIMVQEALAAIHGVSQVFVDMPQLQRHASKIIAKACGTEAGYVTASAAAGVSLAVAGCMTGCDLGAIEALPDTSTFARTEVVIQMGHLVHYGAPLAQALRLTGATVHPVGQSTQCRRLQLEAALSQRTACAVYVVSHHAVSYGQIGLAEFIETCRSRGVPVIVDAASEYDLTGFAAAGADIVLYSAHKFLGGPTAGIVAGRLDLVRAAYLQNLGIGRGMKIGKEGVLGTMAALLAWEQRDHQAIRAREHSALSQWKAAVQNLPGVEAYEVDDPTGNPLQRLRMHTSAAVAGITAWDWADALAQGSPRVIVRNHNLEHGHFDLDPCNLHPGQAALVAQRLADSWVQLRAQGKAPTPWALRQQHLEKALLHWPA